jgi:hypothetical protein
MLESGHLYGGAAIYRRYPVRASIAQPGIPIIAVTDTVGVAPATTTSFADAVGLGKDTVTYSTTQADLNDPGSDANIGAYNTVYGLDAGKVVTVSIRDDLEIKALVSGAATESTALTLLVNTSASAGGTTITDADVGTSDMSSGVVWCTKGANVGHARPIVTHNSATDFVTTVPFPRAIAVGDEFLFIPYNMFGTGASAIDGHGNLQATTNIYQADGSIASGTGGAVMVTGLELNGRSDTFVRFMLADHILKVITS